MQLRVKFRSVELVWHLWTLSMPYLKATPRLAMLVIFTSGPASELDLYTFFNTVDWTPVWCDVYLNVLLDYVRIHEFTGR